MARKERICVVLGGGGARGLSHLGVLQVLEREKIPIDAVVGTSVGAIVGAVYCTYPDAIAVTRKALAYLQSDAFSRNTFKKVLFNSEDVEQNFLQNLLSSIQKSYVFSALLRKPSIFPGERLYDVIADLVPDRNFEDTKIPFAVPALDIRTGEDVVLREGALREAVHASCSLPGFFPPVKRGDYLLADAGVIGPVPVQAALSFAPTTVIAVDITSRLDDVQKVERGLDAIMRVESIACKRLNELALERADVVVRPDVGNRYWSDFSGLEEIVTQGVLAAEARLDEIKAVLSRRRASMWPLSASSTER